MAADMVRARDAIAAFRAMDLSKASPAIIEHLHNLCDTFEWLEESRAGVIKERDELKEQLDEWQQSAMERSERDS